MTPDSPVEDRTLLHQIAQRDQAALSQFYDRYGRLVYAVAYRSLGSVEESEEVVLDVFAQVWRSASEYDATKARADTWLLMMARSRVIDRLRKLQRSTKIEDASVQAEIQSTKTSVDPIEMAFLSERRSQVLNAMNQLPSEQRQVIELAYFNGFSHREIAEQTGLSLGTIKTRIRLGLNKLEKSLDVWRSS